MATILHIDPDEVAQKFVKSTLGYQYNVMSAADGPTAVQYCAMIQPDLILMDLALPDIDGYELTSRLKMFMPQTPILILMANQPNRDKLQTSMVDSDGFISKPIDEDKLWHTVQSFLPQPGQLPQFATSPSSFLSAEAFEQFGAQIDTLNQANKRLASLTAISALIGTSLDLEHLTDEILGQIQKTIDFDSATLFLLKGNILEAAASRGLSDYRRGMNIYTKSDRNSAWRVVNSKLPLIINDVTKSDYWEPRPELSKVRSWLGVPLIYKDRVVGVLTLDKNETDAFIDADARYFFTLAYQIAIAVENTQLFEEWEDQATRLKLINEVSQEIITILDVEHLFDVLAWAIFERLHYDRVVIFEVEETHTSPILRAYYDKLSPHLDADVYQKSVGIQRIAQVINTGMPLAVNAFKHEDEISLSVEEDTQTGLIIPIFIDNQVEAVISVDSSHNLGDQDLWTLSSLANQAATAIENARLYQNIDAYSAKLERTVVARTQRLQAIKKISQVVSQGLDIDELLTVVGQEISQIFASKDSTEDQAIVVVGLVNGSNLKVTTIYDESYSDKTDLQQMPTDPGNLSETSCKIDFQTPAGQVIGHSRPVMLNNMNSQNLYSNFVEANGTSVVNSLMMAPLITGGKTIGLIVVESWLSDAFDDSDLETLESVAFQVATAIEHARLLQKTRELAIVDERTRLARDMHDGVAQNLAYLLIQVDRCLNLVEEGTKVEAQLEQISSVVKRNIEELRRNIFDLRPVDLEGKTLFKALENFVTEFGRRWNLKTSCNIQGELMQVSPEVESSLYRILQETLSNARQHAQCTQLWVELVVKDNQKVSLEVKDDGQGFDKDHSKQGVRKGTSRGLGLVSMRERAEGVGGQLTVESIQGQGTRIFAELPLQYVNAIDTDEKSIQKDNR